MKPFQSSSSWCQWIHSPLKDHCKPVVLNLCHQGNAPSSLYGQKSPFSRRWFVVLARQWDFIHAHTQPAPLCTFNQMCLLSNSASAEEMCQQRKACKITTQKALLYLRKPKLLLIYEVLQWFCMVDGTTLLSKTEPRAVGMKAVCEALAEKQVKEESHNRYNMAYQLPLCNKTHAGSLQ